MSIQGGVPTQVIRYLEDPVPARDADAVGYWLALEAEAHEVEALGVPVRHPFWDIVAEYAPNLCLDSPGILAGVLGSAYWPEALAQGCIPEGTRLPPYPDLVDSVRQAVIYGEGPTVAEIGRRISAYLATGSSLADAEVEGLLRCAESSDVQPGTDPAACADARLCLAQAMAKIRALTEEQMLRLFRSASALSEAEMDEQWGDEPMRFALASLAEHPAFSEQSVRTLLQEGAMSPAAWLALAQAPWLPQAPDLWEEAFRRADPLSMGSLGLYVSEERFQRVWDRLAREDAPVAARMLSERDGDLPIERVALAPLFASGSADVRLAALSALSRVRGGHFDPLDPEHRAILARAARLGRAHRGVGY